MTDPTSAPNLTLQKKTASYRTVAGKSSKQGETVIDLKSGGVASTGDLEPLRVNAEKGVSYRLTDPVTGKIVQPQKVRQIQKTLELTLPDGRVLLIEDFFVELPVLPGEPSLFQAQSEFVFHTGPGPTPDWVIDVKANFVSDLAGKDFVFWPSQDALGVPQWMSAQGLSASALIAPPLVLIPLEAGLGSGLLGALGGAGLLLGGGGGGGAGKAPVAPVFTSVGRVAVDENTASSVVLYTAKASPDVTGKTVVYGISGPDAARFTLNGNTGALTFKASPDADAPLDVGADNVYNFTITARDSDGLTSEQTVVLTVNDRPDNLPVFKSGTTAIVQENLNTANFIYKAEATPDLFGAVIKYTLAGADADLFEIDPSSGELRFKASPDHENPRDLTGGGAVARDNLYTLIISAAEAGGRTATRTVTITVLDVADVAPVFTSGQEVAVDENVATTTTVYRAQATPDLLGGSVRYSLGGVDSSRFIIDAVSGEVKFTQQPNFESPSDQVGSGSAAQDNKYDITVVATDIANNALSTTQSVRVTVADVGDALTFKSLAAAEVFENVTGTVYTAAAVIDSPLAIYTYSLSGGADDALFNINASNGALSFKNSPDFEAPADAGGNNQYDVTVVASLTGFTPVSGGVTSISQNVAIRVKDVVADQIIPTAQNLQGVTNLDVRTDLVVNFASAVNLTSNANVKLRIVHDGGGGFQADAAWSQQVAGRGRNFEISLTDSSQVRLSADGRSLVINPLGDLDFGCNYHIEIDSGAFFSRADPTGTQPSAAVANLATFGTVLPASSVTGAASQKMTATGGVVASQTYIDIQGRGGYNTVDTALDLSSGDYTLVYKDQSAAAGSASTTGIGTGSVGFNLQVNGWGAGDRLYFDDQTAVNALSSNNVGAFGDLLDRLADNTPAAGDVPNLVGVLQIDPGGVGKPHAWIGFGMFNKATFDLTGNIATSVISA